MLSRRPLALVPLVSLATVSVAAAQQSAALFDSPVVVTDGTHRFERTLDLDADGFQDAFGWYVVDNYYSKIRLRGYVNDRSGGLNEAWTVTVSGDFDLFEHSASTVGDWNQDGREDFAFSAQGEMRAYVSNGIDPPTEILDDGTFKRPYGMATAELTGDEWPDIAVLRESLPFQPREIVIWRNDAGTGFTQVAAIPVVGGAIDLVATDTDGDGEADLVYNSVSDLRIIPQVDGVFGTEVTITHGVTDHPMLTNGDVDGDGDEDFVVFGMTAYSIIRNDGSGFSAEPITVGGPATGLADIDADGDLDGVCCGSGGPTETFNRADSKFEIAINDGTGAFAPSFQIQGLGSHHLAGAVDLENDGDLDLVAGRCIYYSRGSIAEPPMPAVTLDGVEYAVSARSMWDAEGDGDVDFVAGAGMQSLNLGDGRSQASAPIVTGNPPGTSHGGPGFMGDFDGDGLEDLIVSGFQGPNFTSMRLLAGNGGGGYTDVGAAGPDGVDFNSGTCILCDPLFPDDPRMGFVHDFDNDGDLDLATTTPLDYTSGTTRFFRNDGTGFLSFWFNHSGLCLQAIADLNGDGLDDLITAGQNALGFTLGQVDPVWPFEPFVSLGIGSDVLFSDEIAVADLDGDGDPDIASFEDSSVYSCDTYLFWNDGAAGFTPELQVGVELGQSYSSNEIDSRVFAGDLNGDGLNDLVWSDALYNIWPEHARTVAIQLRNGDNTGWEPTYYQVGDPSALVDVDGDGDLDMVGSSVAFGTRWGAEAGSRRQYGAGSPGSGGMVPTLGASGPFRIGETPEIFLTGAVGGGPSFLVFGDTETALAGWPAADNTLLVDVFGGLSFSIGPFASGTPGAPGNGGFALPIGVGPALVGLPWYHQAVTFDLTDPEIIVSSNGLELVYAP